MPYPEIVIVETTWFPVPWGEPPEWEEVSSSEDNWIEVIAHEEIYRPVSAYNPPPSTFTPYPDGSNLVDNISEITPNDSTYNYATPIQSASLWNDYVITTPTIPVDATDIVVRLYIRARCDESSAVGTIILTPNADNIDYIDLTQSWKDYVITFETSAATNLPFTPDELTNESKFLYGNSLLIYYSSFSDDSMYVSQFYASISYTIPWETV